MTEELQELAEVMQQQRKDDLTELINAVRPSKKSFWLPSNASEWSKLLITIGGLMLGLLVTYASVSAEWTAAREHREGHAHPETAEMLRTHSRQIQDIFKDFNTLKGKVDAHQDPASEIHETKYQKQLGIQRAMEPLSTKVASIEKKLDRILILQEAETVAREKIKEK